MTGNFVGKYRGKVLNNIDPLMLGRIIPLVPGVSELPLSWALPCAPYAGDGVGFFALPPIGANVWIEFEGGDPNHPIWVGGFWGKGEAPAMPAIPTTKVLQTEQLSIKLDDLLTGVTIEAKTPSGTMEVQLDPQGVKLKCNGVEASLTQPAITLKHSGSKLDVTPQGIGLEFSGGKLDIKAGTVALKQGANGMDITSGSVGLKNGVASIDMAAGSVSINKGALEVK